MVKVMDKVFKVLGASNHTDHDRAKYDFYATNPIAIDKLLKKETINHKVWECACGKLHLANRLKEVGYKVRCSDIVNRLSDKNIEIIDFLKYEGRWGGDIITNPPYSLAKEFVLKAIDVVECGYKVYMFLKLLFLESQNRYKDLFSKYPPKNIYVFSKRINCAINGDFKQDSESAQCYAWYVWEKGYKGLPKVDWLL